MSLQIRLSDLITRVGTEFKAIRTLISGTGTGNVSALTTTSTNLVAAINEVKVTADGAVSAAAVLINDTTPSTTTVYSSTKTTADIGAAVSALVAASPAALDTLNELAVALGNDANFATTISTAIGLKANSADVYTQAQLGDPETNLVTLFNAALA